MNFKSFYILILLCTCLNTYSKSADNYHKAIKQMLLEYTVFGVDECLSNNVDSIALNESALTDDKILIGSHEYFEFLSKCFKEQIATCKGDCITKVSMEKRLENISHMQKLLKKYSR